MKALLDAHGLKLNGTAPRFRGDFINGELGNADPVVADKALQLCREACDYCRAAGGDTVTICLCLDGFAIFSFQIDYTRVWNQLVGAYRAVCDYAPDLKISIEYKPFEERSYAFIDSMGITGMMFLPRLIAPNLGVTLDYCHMLMKHENPAMACDIFGGRGKLFGVHLNDGWRCHGRRPHDRHRKSMKTLEFIYYLKSMVITARLLRHVPHYRRCRRGVPQNIAMIHTCSIEQLRPWTR